MGIFNTQHCNTRRCRRPSMLFVLAVENTHIYGITQGEWIYPMLILLIFWVTQRNRRYLDQAVLGVHTVPSREEIEDRLWFELWRWCSRNCNGCPTACKTLQLLRCAKLQLSPLRRDARRHNKDNYAASLDLEAISSVVWRIYFW